MLVVVEAPGGDVSAMTTRRSLRATFGIAALLAVTSCGTDDGAAEVAAEEERNQVAGTWRMVSAVADPGGPGERRPYGDDPDGMLTFNENGTFVEVLQDTGVAPFAGGARIGTAEENAAVVGGSLGQFGTYTVDADGAFQADTIIGSTWPNRNGVQYRTPELTLTVEGDRLTEVLRSPGRPLLRIEFTRVP